MKYIITGRCGCGRHDLLRALAERGLRVAKSATSRPKRYEGEDTHHFLTDDEAALVPASDKILPVTINGHESFYAIAELQDADVISLTPDAIPALAALMPDETFHLVHIIIEDDMERKLYAVRSADDKLREEEFFNDRDMEEDAAFCDYEADTVNYIKEGEDIPSNVTCVFRYVKDYNPENVAHYADYLVDMKKGHDRLDGLVKEAVRMDILQDKDGRVGIVRLGDGDTTHTDYVTTEHFADTLMSDDEGMALFMKAYLKQSERFKDLD